MNITEPEDIIVNFLRANLSELTRLDEDGNTISNRQTLRTETFDGDNLETEFVMTNNTTCFKTVSVGGSELVPYKDYQIDINNKKVTFTNAPATGTDNIEVIYYSGNNWIYPDKPRDNIGKTTYPRIGIVTLTQPNPFKGIGDYDKRVNNTFQIDVLGHKDQFCQIDSENVPAERYVKYLARKVIDTIASTTINKHLEYKIENLNVLNNYPVPFEEDKNIFRQIIEINVLFRYVEA